MTIRQGDAKTAQEVKRREKVREEPIHDVGFEERIRAWGELRGLALKPERGRNARGAKTNGQVEFRAPAADAYAEMLHAWRQRVRRTRKRDKVEPAPPSAPPATNWIPIGPSVLRRGQASGEPAVSGRTAALAIAPGGMRVYAATANGGAWRSDNGGQSWVSMLDGWDLDPTTVGVDSQSCGAIALDPASPDRVYIGTGEGEASIFFGGVFGVVFSYAGVGPLRTDDGGVTWVNEPIASGSPSLNGQAFYDLVLDPADRERVVAATTGGTYLREPDGGGGYQWRRTRTGNCTSVAVARTGGVTTFFAAMNGGPVVSSADGSTWTTLGSYPAGASRVSLAVRRTDPSIVYAFSSLGVHRYDASAGVWRSVSGAPSLGQSDYKMTIAIDPTDATRLYFGGTSLARGIVSSSGSGPSLTYSMAVTSIGGDVHPDIHRLVMRQDASTEMWVACDGGVFRTTNAATGATFTPRNTGLSTMTCTYLDHHPTEPAVVFCGAQDNGTMRFTGEEVWFHSADGDGGANVVNWNDPYKIIRSYVYGALMRTTNGGQSTGSWSSVTPAGATGALFYPPLVGTPRNPGSPGDADIVATGASRTWFSPNFGTSWSTPDTADLDGTVSALVFRSATELYAGTTTGRVYRYTRTGATWSAGSLVGQVGGGAAGLAPIVTDIAIDPAGGTSSFYVCLGGAGDWRRVWHYDGSSWANRSGPSAASTSSLLPVHFNALVVDPMNPTHIFAGADIGIWRSDSSGSSWTPYQEGLPDAGVVDMQLHPTRRLLRASTYGRGVYERDIDAATAAGVELYVRDTDLDLGRWSTVDWLNDPEAPGGQVRHWAGPNIKVDPPSSSGTYQTPTTSIDFLQFVDQIVDGSDGVATRDPATGTVVNRVYVEVHNRGVTPANGVKVKLLVTNASTALNDLPTGYTTNVQMGTAITSADWKTVGTVTLNGLRVGYPQIAEFDLPSTLLAPPASLPGQSHYCVLALLHSADDVFTNTQRVVDALSVGERKAAHKNLHLVAYTGPVEPGPMEPMLAAVELNGRGRLTDLLLDLERFKGNVSVILPKAFANRGLEKRVDGGRVMAKGKYDALVRKHAKVAERMLKESRSDPRWSREAIERARGFLGSAPVRFSPDQDRALVGVRKLDIGKQSVPVLLVLEAPEGARLGDRWELDLIQADSARGRVIGGSTYACCVTLPPDDTSAIDVESELRRVGRSDIVEVLAMPTVDGKLLTGKEARVDAVKFTAAGADAAPEALAWDEKRQAFALKLNANGDGPRVRRLTLLARHGDTEGRKTIDVPAAE